jgi:hypothetical protein
MKLTELTNNDDCRLNQNLLKARAAIFCSKITLVRVFQIHARSTVKTGHVNNLNKYATKNITQRKATISNDNVSTQQYLISRFTTDTASINTTAGLFVKRNAFVKRPIGQ